MIIIHSTYGVRFVNEAEVTDLNHDKENALVAIRYKDNHQTVLYNVERITYTTKQDAVFVDEGLLLAKVFNSKEYYVVMNESATSFSEEMAYWRNELERSYLELYKDPDSNRDYYESLYQKILKKRKGRPQSVKDELGIYRQIPCYQTALHDKEKGEAAEKEFERMASLIAELKEKNEQLEKKAQKSCEGYEYMNRLVTRLMNRNLWQRIFNMK